MKDKLSAALLALFLGGLGVHRFYLNQPGRGILYLLFCWTFIPAFLGLIDFVGLLIMSEDTFNLKYNQKYNVVVNVGEQSHHSSIDELKKLHELKEQGIITQEEFEMKKRDLLR